MSEKPKHGRPAFQPTTVMRRKVANAAGGGMPHEEIALALGISRGTLEKHFELELSVGACGKRLEVLDAMQRTAKRGNVAAQKAYLGMTPAVAAPPPEKPARPPKLGKKEQADADAASAASGDKEWNELLPGTPTLQ